MLKRGQNVSVHYEKTEKEGYGEYEMHGVYLKEDDEYVYVKGTVGDKIGQRIAIPKRRIIYMEFGRMTEDD